MIFSYAYGVVRLVIRFFGSKKIIYEMQAFLGSPHSTTAGFLKVQMFRRLEVKTDKIQTSTLSLCTHVILPYHRHFLSRNNLFLMGNVLFNKISGCNTT